MVRLVPAEQLARHGVGPLKRRSSKAQSNYLSNWCRNCGVPLGSHLLGEELLAAEKPFDRYPISGDMMALLLLDDTWTEFVRGQVPPDDHTPFALELIADMRRLLAGMGDAAGIIRHASERLGPDLNARFHALTWGDGTWHR